ncbi:MAG TPA: PQQ-binding-like beta-propeller repeat protein, partial [Planctomycetaceae bacterium]|nr:PQQ-binding-like beta-propeller repeat protein [Planctomycetaceae bacterium]
MVRCWVIVAVSLIPSVIHAAEKYPFSLPLKTLEQDLTSVDYRAVLATMIPTDLRAEWQRVATSDNYRIFERQHGGVEKREADPELQQAYQHRKEIADRFLKLIAEAYAGKKQKPPFADEALLNKVLDSADRRGGDQAFEVMAIRPIFPAVLAAEHWPSFRGPTQQGAIVSGGFPKEWNTHWKTALPGRGNSSPIVWGDHVFVTAEGPRPEAANESPERFLIALDRADGHVLWKHTAPAPTAVETLYWKNTFASSTMVTDG